MYPPILITGAARSGTSLVAGIVHFCGAWGGHSSNSTKWNKKGFFENLQIRELIIKPYLRTLGVDPLGQYPLPNVDSLAPCPNIAQRVEFIFKTQGYTGQKCFFKGAKLCLVWPVFHADFPDSKWIIVRRDDADIVNSCMQTSFMRKLKTEAEWQEWVDHHKERFREMHDSEMQVKEVWPKKFLEGDFSEIKEVIEWVGLDWNEKRVHEFINPKLYHRGKKSWQESPQQK